MLGLLKYKAKEGSPEQQEAMEALEYYTLANREQRRTFLQAFQINGGSKGGLKFMSSVRRSMTQVETVSTGQNMDMLTRAQIMAQLQMQALQGEEADAVIAALLEDNKRKYGHAGMVHNHPDLPVLTTYKWVTNLGVKKQHACTDEDTVDRHA